MNKFQKNIILHEKILIKSNEKCYVERNFIYLRILIVKKKSVKNSFYQ